MKKQTPYFISLDLQNKNISLTVPCIFSSPSLDFHMSSSCSLLSSIFLSSFNVLHTSFAFCNFQRAFSYRPPHLFYLHLFFSAYFLFYCSPHIFLLRLLYYLPHFLLISCCARYIFFFLLRFTKLSSSSSSIVFRRLTDCTRRFASLTQNNPMES